ncbi:hypothetical protein [Arthrobacter oryzae]|uniref:hypothetical protein n=1 Tax=Arthrobacter oryzae TaxID=409290 RepID=UPI000EB437BD
MSRPPVNPEDPSEDPRGNPRENSSQRPGQHPLPGADGGPAGPAVRPRAVVVIAVVVALEAAALLLAAAWYGTQLLSGAPVASFWGAVFTLGLLLAFSAWLFAVARFLLRGFRWPRAGALVTQLFVLTIGFPTLTGGYPLAGLAMLVPAVLTIVLLFDKRVIAFASRAAGAPPAL